MASFTNDLASYQLQQGGTPIVWASDTIKARLVASSFTPAKTDTAMTGYTAIGTDQTLSGKTLTNDTSNNRTTYTNTSNLTWSAVAGGSTVGWIVVYKFVSNDAGSTPMFIVDVTDTPTNGSDIVWSVSASGIAYTQQ